MKKHFRKTLLASMVAIAVPMTAFAFDAELAAKVNAVTSKMDQQGLKVPPVDGDRVLKLLANGDKFHILDVRTPEERSYTALALPNAVAIPLSELFTKDNLEKVEALTKQGMVLVACKDGGRAQRAVSFLTLLGMKGVVPVKGGYDGIAAAVTPGTAVGMRPVNADGWQVKWAGSTPTSSTYIGPSPQVPLKPYVDMGNVIALGPIKGARGELAMENSVPWWSQIRDGKPTLQNDETATTNWIVYAQVKEWKEIDIPDRINDERLNWLIRLEAIKLGINPEVAMPFRIKGKIDHAHVSITNLVDDGKPMSPEKKAAINTYWELHDKDADIIGFRSTGHKGIFMPDTMNLHMHARTKESVYHVEAITLVAGAKLYLPVK
jgi:acetolactate decarboxylase